MLKSIIVFIKLSKWAFYLSCIAIFNYPAFCPFLLKRGMLERGNEMTLEEINILD